MSDEDRTAVWHAAVLHDIGKAAVPDAILGKPGPLDDSDWEFMRRHTVIGERILQGAPALASSAPLVRSSHERHDGTGYPDGLAGDGVPLGARIIAVCDAYDAMLSTRSVPDGAVARDRPLEELQRCAGTQFDPDVVRAFFTTLERSERSDMPHSPTRRQRGCLTHSARMRLLRALCSTSARPSASSTGGT